MPVAKTHGMGFTVWSPLAGGLLTGKYNDGIPKGSRGESSQFMKITEEKLAKVRKIGEIASSLDITTGQLALAWILRHREISAALVGATKPEHVIENIGASDVTLSKDTIEEIEGILNNTPEWPPTYRPNIYYQDKMG